MSEVKIYTGSPEQENGVITVNGKEYRNEPRHPVTKFVMKTNYDTLSLENRRLKKEVEVVRHNFKSLVENCKWYASNGTEQERHHFLMVEAEGNFLDCADAEISEAVKGVT